MDEISLFLGRDYDAFIVKAIITATARFANIEYPYAPERCPPRGVQNRLEMTARRSHSERSEESPKA